MDREKAKALLPIIEAYANGETIQLYTGARWEDSSFNLTFSDPVEYYRIKPAPRTFYCIEWDSGNVAVFKSKKDRDSNWDKVIVSGAANSKITLVEVLE